MRNLRGSLQKRKETCDEGQAASPHRIIALLKEFAERGDLYAGVEAHNHIANSPRLKDDAFVNNTLVRMYARCGAVETAQGVFDELRFRDVVSWNALLTGYAQSGAFCEASECSERSVLEGSLPNAVTLVSMLKICGKTKALHKGRMVHAQIAGAEWLDGNEFIGSGLVDMYARCGSISMAEEAFNGFPTHTSVSWNVLILGYAHRGCNESALGLFEAMKAQSFAPDEFTVTCILKACGAMGASRKGEEIHAAIAKGPLLGRDRLVGNALVYMYAKCGALVKARDAFGALPFRDAASYNTLIGAYCREGRGEEAMACFEALKSEGFAPNSVTFLCMSKACGTLQAVRRAQEMHVQVMVEGLSPEDVVIGNALVDMYCRCGSLARAQEAFDEVPTRDVVTWNALITGYERRGQAEEALNRVEEMCASGFSPDAITYACGLRACGGLRDVAQGEKLHAEILKNEPHRRNTAIGTSLVDMYARCGALAKAQDAFEDLRAPSVAAWNVLISGYVRYELNEEALACFHRMQSRCSSPDAVTFACILKACGSAEAVEKGREIHAEIARQGLIGENSILGTALVDMYAKCGDLAKAGEAFDAAPVRDVFSWNVLIAGNAQRGYCEEALNRFEEMRLGGSICPDAVTFIGVLKACSGLGSVARGQEAHIGIVKGGLPAAEILVGNALVDMYASCGAPEEAQLVFDSLPCRDQVSWTSLMRARTQLGEEEAVLDAFRAWIREAEALPDDAAFASILNACAHQGLVEEGESLYFATMTESYGVAPTLEQSSCMVDLFGRAGQLEKSVALIERMPFCDDARAWLALLGICRNSESVSLGELAFQHVLELDERNVGAYVYMSNAYATWP